MLWKKKKKVQIGINLYIFIYIIVLIKNFFHYKNFFQINIFKLNYYYLLFFRYSKWKLNLLFNYNFYFFFLIKLFFFKINFNLLKLISSSKISNLKQYIRFKLKLSIFKKYNSLKFIYFHKTLNKFKTKSLYFYKKKKRTSFPKFFDFKKRLFGLLKENRDILKVLFLNKFCKQKKVTKFIQKFKHKSIINKLLWFECSLFNILIQSNFITYKSDIYFFLKNGFIFVNGKVVTNMFYQVCIGDRVQLVISNMYYHYHRFVKLFLKKIIFKIKQKQKQKKTFDLYKQRSRYIPFWILKVLFYKNSIPRYLEVDFQTLTTTMLFLPNRMYYFNFVFLKFISLFNFRLYNWKKIN